MAVGSGSGLPRIPDALVSLDGRIVLNESDDPHGVLAFGADQLFNLIFLATYYA